MKTLSTPIAVIADSITASCPLVPNVACSKVSVNVVPKPTSVSEFSVSDILTELLYSASDTELFIPSNVMELETKEKFAVFEIPVVFTALDAITKSTPKKWALQDASHLSSL